MCRKLYQSTLILVVMASVLLVSLMSPQSIQANDKLEALTFVLDYTPNTNHTGLYVAQDQGYFTDEGLEVTIVQPPEDGAPALVASGKAEFGMGYQDTIAPAFALDNPLPVTSIAAVIQHNTSGIISQSSNPISRPKDLEGKTYATWGMPIEQGIVKTVIEKDGGDPDQLNLVTAESANIYNMEKSDYDAVWVYYAWDVMNAEANNIDYEYFAFVDFDPTFDYYTPIIIGNNDFIEENPETTKAFLRAVKKGYEFAINYPEEAADILLKAAPELDEKTVQMSQTYLQGQYIADVDQWGYIDSERWNRFFDWLYEEGLIESEIPADFGFTNAYLPEQ